MTFGPPVGPPGFSPPGMPAQPAFGGPISSAQALAGLGSADLETRLPFLPPGAAVRMKVSRAYERTITKGNLGVCYFVEGTVTDVAQPGGAEFWQGKRQDNMSLAPARVGGEYSCRISGISAQGSQQAALREYRDLLAALWAHRGLSTRFGQGELAAAQTANDANAFAAAQSKINQTWLAYGVMTAQYEAILAGRQPGDRAMAEQFKNEIEGKHILVQTGCHVGQTGWGKLKHSFFPDAQAITP